MRYVDGDLHWHDPTVIGSTDAKSVRRITSYLITRGQDFAVNYKENEWYIFLSDHVDLSRLQDKLKNINFEL